MAIFKAVNLKIGKRRRANLSGVIKYVLKFKKTEDKLVYCQCLELERAYDMMIETKKTFDKEKGREYYHYVQSFPPNENITPEQALEQAKEFLERTKKFRSFEVLVATHKDRAHIHTHFIVNSVSFVDGKKFHISNKELEELKRLQNQINIEKGYSAAPPKGIGIDGKPRTETIANDKNTFHLLQRAANGQIQSYVQSCAISVLVNSKKALNKEEFIQLMDQDGFSTTWDEKKKHITFTDKLRAAKGETKCKIRLAKLSEYYAEFNHLNTKEDLINGFNANSRISAEERRKQDSELAELDRIKEELRQNRNTIIDRGNAKSDQGLDGTEFDLAEPGKQPRENENVDSRGDSETIDFNSKFEEYSERINRDRAEQAAAEAERRERQRIEEERRKLQQQNKSISEQHTSRNKESEIDFSR